MARRIPLLFAALAICLFVVAALGRHQSYLVARDYVLHVSVPCDPAASSCFLACADEDGVDCTGEPYAKAVVKAQDAPRCLEEHDCPAFSCDGRRQCSISYCAEGARGEGERCVADAP